MTTQIKQNKKQYEQIKTAAAVVSGKANTVECHPLVDDVVQQSPPMNRTDAPFLGASDDTSSIREIGEASHSSSSDDNVVINLHEVATADSDNGALEDQLDEDISTTDTGDLQ
ncbi:hypothetical protein K7X08_002378 [Anisodus acutangulus]|uniref:Uncharacterized protein n=1 Tax=Anisodus acutangulus TaxID=402998 RepID=A0A9Q1LPC8_9SOLA|nr:hypothetical protein K7X08_002378 [Anisodus acutangulus]